MTQEERKSASGGCLCGGVRYAVHGPLRPVAVCHCGMCRRFHGHVGAYTNVALADVVFENNATLAWYRSSDKAQRGFCRNCGSSLFWQADGSARIAIAAGTLDTPTGLTTVAHINVASAGDYYTIDGDLPKHPNHP